MPSPAPTPFSHPRRMAALQLARPQWFARADFQAWLRDERRAAWYRGDEPGVPSDVFMLVEPAPRGGRWALEGSDLEGFPPDLLAELTRTLEAEGWGGGVVWLTATP